MTVLIRIQHAVGREVPRDRLLAQLPPAVEVITDTQAQERANPWRGYQLCLSHLPDEGHVLVLQDDTIVCDNFVPAVEQIAAANPDTIVCLFVAGNPRRTVANVREALVKGRPYAWLAWHDFLPVVATLWPVHIATEFLTWATTHANIRRLPGGPVARSDDAVAGRWLRFSRRRVRCTAPSLVQHPDDFPSTIMKPAKHGRDLGRVAAHYIGDGDPLEIDWSRLAR